jgi:hypothetical protein
VNTEQLRQSVKEKWLNYYEENREWLSRLGVWVNCEGQRRPSSGFILAVLSTLEPRLTHLLPLIVDLSSNPDRIILALGLNFNPEECLEGMAEAKKAIAPDRTTSENGNGEVKLLPAAMNEIISPSVREIVQVRAREDEYCRGSHPDDR